MEKGVIKRSAGQNPAKTRINLSTISRNRLADLLFKWVINGGRIIIVLTELITLGALFYRFVIDGQIVDLHDQIKIEESIVKAQEQKEMGYRSIQERLTNVDGLSKEASSRVNTLNTLISSIESQNLTVDSFLMSQSSIAIEGQTFSIFVLNDFIENLKKTPDIKSINIDQITNRKSGIDFKVVIEMEAKSG
ncbi:hypothetical protein C4577_01420 [Candidatus Parcubacteria bacterium]|nr:MAG: hypothetical protein C4577_01420 [Candidatus Parcubacteria bacterium]